MINQKLRNTLKYVLLAFTFFYLNSCINNDNELIYADASNVWWLAPTIIAKEKGFYEKNNLNIKTFDVRTGLESKNAVLSGSADVGMVAATPLAIGAYSKENVIVIASFVESDNLIAIISTDSIIKEPIAVVPGTISQFYFYNYMRKHFNSFDLDNAEYLHMGPAALTSSLTNNNAKTAVIWEPFVSNFNSKRKKYIEIRERELYTLKLFIITRPDVLKTKRKEVMKFVKSIHDACNYINSDQNDVREFLSKKFNNQKIPINIWETVDFNVKTGKNNCQIMRLDIFNDARLSFETKIKDTELQVSDLDYLFDHNFILH